MYNHRFYYFFIFFIPLEQFLNYVFGYYTELKIYRLLLFTTVFLLSFTAFKLKRLNKPPFGLKSFIFILLYGLCAALMRISNGNGLLSYLENSLQHFIIGLCIFYVLSTIRDHKHLLAIGKYFVLATLISSLYGINSYILMPQFRLHGFFHNPNHLAFAINILSPYLVYRFINKSNIISLLLIVFFSITVFFTGSRTGLMVQALNILLLLFLTFKTYKQIALPILLVFIAGTYIYISSRGSVLVENKGLTSRFESDNMQNASGRWDIADAAIRLGIDTKFTGVGIGQYKFYHLKYVSSNAYSTVTKYDLGTHNHFLDLLVNFGIIPFILYILFLVGVIRKIFRISSHLRPFLLCSFFGVSLISLSQEVFTLPVFWMYIGLFISLLEILKLKHDYGSQI